MAFLADRQRQLMVGHDDLGNHLFVVETYLLHPGRAQRLSDEGRLVFPPLDDIDLLAAQLVDHLAHPRPACTHAGADRIYVGIVRGHCDLGPVPGLAGDRPDLDITVDQFGHFELEQRPDEFRVAARNDDLRALALATDLENVRLHPVAALQALVRDALG